MSKEGARKTVKKMAELLRDKPRVEWENPVEAPVPAEAINCKHCGGRCMYCEQLQNDWFGRGVVCRIGSLCDEAFKWEGSHLDNAFAQYKGGKEIREIRTEFAPQAEAVKEWNAMNIRKPEDE